VQQINTKNIYLPNLNGLRFVAAMFVFISHVEAVKNNFNILNNTIAPFFDTIGKLGVVLFFVLSGLLITYLLLNEEKHEQTISIKKFYIRRILRIWPLYFLIVAFALFVAPRTDFFHLANCESGLNGNTTLPISLLFLFFLPNGVIAHFGVVPYAVQTWSIGVEEQFYLTWPLLVKKIKNRAVLFPAVFIVYNVIKVALIALQHQSQVFKILLQFWYYFNIDCMALGAMAAYIVFYKKEKIQRVLFNRVTQVITLALLTVLIGFGYQFKYMHFEIYGVLFSIMVINLAFNPKTLLKLENPVFNYLGKISYGIYMYHFIALTITIRILQHYTFLNNFAIYSLGFITTIGLSALSYHFFESWFLTIKKRFAFFESKKPLRGTA
jgi:peptidoglycan/LPS O-acetylase OafA/YrhL